VPIKNVDVITKRLRDLYDNPGQAAAMGESARETAYDFTWDRHKHEFVETCEEY
jgi:glycosyltransferase involved in cell wall biosynthesis